MLFDMKIPAAIVYFLVFIIYSCECVALANDDGLDVADIEKLYHALKANKSLNLNEVINNAISHVKHECNMHQDDLKHFIYMLQSFKTVLHPKETETPQGWSFRFRNFFKTYENFGGLLYYMLIWDENLYTSYEDIGRGIKYLDSALDMHQEDLKHLADFFEPFGALLNPIKSEDIQDWSIRIKSFLADFKKFGGLLYYMLFCKEPFFSRGVVERAIKYLCNGLNMHNEDLNHLFYMLRSYETIFHIKKDENIQEWSTRFDGLLDCYRKSGTLLYYALLYKDESFVTHQTVARTIEYVCNGLVVEKDYLNRFVAHLRSFESQLQPKDDQSLQIWAETFSRFYLVIKI